MKAVLIRDAQIRARVRGLTAHQALESVIDDCRAANPGTTGAAILQYYRQCSEAVMEALIRAVQGKEEA